ncbi:hypothetical protein IDJ77_23280 [Mucilaginibacter sp. ZT4R22]|uniref:Uncharacterized protein n=1 Tax=Mucilaginibacter pankratovii TaxID=2772110 RepID=A0ABR7WZ79_9SPHI|nr:hypothetical protein [Mucilaginibacter pankratovii]MBD1366754.1 hypothetical protein [Mucilaginibacter pankratovii]
MKSDKSIRNICLAAIKRRSSRPFDFQLTKIFESTTFDDIEDAFRITRVNKEELPISQTFIDENNWTLVTTRQIITSKQGIQESIQATEVKSWHWNDFKGYDKTSYTLGELHRNGGSDFEVFIETGRASMVSIYAIMTLVGQLA